MLNDFEIKNGTLVEYHGSDTHDTHVVIPDSVTEIGADAFRGRSSLPSIVIPDSVTKIGKCAFINCSSLTSIVIPNSVTYIGGYAFCGCSSLTSIEIPDSVTFIGPDAFYGCSSLTYFIIPDGVWRIREDTFYGCSSLTSIVIPDSVTKIGECAFINCSSLTSIVIPNSVTYIGADAFCGCSSLTSIIIPDSVTKIDSGSFESGSFNNCPRITIICRESSCAHQYCVKYRYNFVFDYQYEAYHGVLPPGIEKLQAPFLADEEKPYIFVSYSHKDRDEVLWIIKELYEAGWRIWYDEGLTIGDRYDETLEEHVKNCSVFLLFITENSRSSLYIAENEIPWAEVYNKPVVKCILDKGTDIAVKEDSVAATVGRGEIEPALNMIGGLMRGERREAKGISVIVDPANRSEVSNGDSFAYCLYAKESTTTAKAILLEAKNSGCTLYDAVENGADEEKLQSAACLIVFLDKAFLSNGNLTKILVKEFQKGKDIAVCLLKNIEDSDLPEGLIALHKMQWLNFVHGLAGDMHTKLARHLQKRGCRNTAVLPGFEYNVTDKGIIITRYKGVEQEPRLESEYGGVPVTKIGEGAFKNCINLEKLVIPYGITEIVSNAFWGCSRLTSIVIPNSVTIIGRDAFWGCSSLISIVIPNSVREIENGAFCGCSNLTSIVIPNSVTTIGGDAFWGCSSLTSIVIPNSVTTIGGDAFYGCSSLTSIVMPNSVRKIESAFCGCSSLTSVVIPAGVTGIGAMAFKGCSSLTSIVIPDSVKVIGYGAFAGCSSMTSIVIPKRVTYIGSETFRGCSSLTSIVIPDSVEGIGEDAFRDCSSLTSIVIPNSVTNIGERAFYNCSSLTSIVIPDSVTSIGRGAFIRSDSHTVICTPGSYACQYCVNNRIPVKAPEKAAGKTEPEDNQTKRPGFFSGLFGKK